MPVNLNDWLGDHVWAWWLCALVLVLSSAAIAKRLVVLASAAGPAAAAVMAAIRPDQFWLQAWIGAGTSVLAAVLVALIGRRTVSADGPVRPAA